MLTLAIRVGLPIHSALQPFGLCAHFLRPQSFERHKRGDMLLQFAGTCLYLDTPQAGFLCAILTWNSRECDD